MKIDEVPNDAGKLDGEKELCYAEDVDGRYVAVKSEGWEAKNIALDQAWDYIQQQIQRALEDIQKGKMSNLAYYMACNQMDVSLLAAYSGFSKRTIKKHLKPKHFNELDEDALNRYASLFKIPVAQLKQISIE
jgi:hypothetical protein